MNVWETRSGQEIIDLFADAIMHYTQKQYCFAMSNSDATEVSKVINREIRNENATLVDTIPDTNGNIVLVFKK